jgi:hypothetical protein
MIKSFVIVFLFLVCSVVSVRAQQYDASPVHLFQNSAGTIPVTAVGQPVAYVTEVVTAGPNLTQPNSTKACVYEQDAQGKNNIHCLPTHCVYSSSIYTATANTWVVGAYSVVGTNSSELTFGARSANNAYIGITSSTGYKAIGGIVDPVLGSMTIGTASASVSQGISTITDLLTAPGTESVSMNNGTPWNKSIPITASYTLPNLRVGINTGSAGNTCGAGNDVHFYGGAILNAPTTNQMTPEVAALESSIGLDILQGQAYDIFLIWGQSNATGKGSAATSVAVPWGQGVEFEDGAIKPLVDPTRHYAIAPGGNVSVTGSMWPSFAAAYYAQTGRRAMIVGGAYVGVGVTTTEGGGTGWIGHPEYRAFLANKALAAQAFIQTNGGTATIKALVFEDGEADGFAAVNPTTFETGMDTVRNEINGLLSMPSLPMVCISIDKSTTPSQDAAFAAIRGAINDYCTTQPNVYMVAPYQDFADAGELIDNIHWNQTALNYDGTLSGKTAGIVLP